MNNPTLDADGLQTWKPQPGEYYEGGLLTRESYAGIVASVQDIQKAWGCGIPKSYPHNFSGIIAAIEDLSECLRVTADTEIAVGTTPAGWGNAFNPDGSPGGDWLVPPIDGTLWYDTRQGRLMVAVDGEYWQTNGAEGLAHVGTNSPTADPVIGQSWYDTYNKILYICTTPGQWEAVRGATDAGQATADLPLSYPSRLFDGLGNGNILPSDFPASSAWPSNLPALDTSNQNTQADLNEWQLWAIVELAKAVETNRGTFIAPAAPTENIQAGDIWYDSANPDLKIYDGTQWVSATKSLSNLADLDALEAEVNAEITNRSNAINDLRGELTILINEKSASTPAVVNRIDALEADVAAIPNIDPVGLARLADIEVSRAGLQTKIDEVRAEIPAIDNLHTIAAAASEHAALVSQIQERVSQSELQAVIDQIPDISNLTSSQEVANAIANITTEYLPRTGGTLSGAFVVEKQDMANPAFDFSQEKWYSYNTHKYRTNSTGDHYSTFGTNTNPWEYAWDFSSNEDFCWVHDNNKVFSVTKDGPACSQLILGDFQPNDTTNGRTLINQVNVREKLATHDSTLATHTQQLADIISGTYTNDSGVIYSDTAPTGHIDDGALWFDSHNIRLNVRHQGAWIYPDRVEDTALKTALFSAISQSNDFETLKIKLLAALV